MPTSIRSFVLTVTTIFLACLLPAFGQQRPRFPGAPGMPGAEATPPPAPMTALPPYPKDDPALDEPIVTHHSITVAGKALAYTATTGTLPIYVIENHERELEGRIFFVAYTLDNGGTPGSRPLTFSYNGGPGSPSPYVHIGGFGPRRVDFPPDGSMPPPPYRLVDNQETWLPFTDLVFVDAMGTGYSRPTTAAMLRRASGVEGDLEAFGEFIRAYLLKYNRFTSPLFLAGESYGTFRSAGLAGYLINHGIALNGVILLSSVLNLQTISYANGNDLPYVLYLPTLTATAWYHKKLPPDLQRETLEQVVHQSEQWTFNGYQQALDQGDQLQGAARQAAIQQLARFTGLSPHYLDLMNLRVNTGEFEAELLREQGLVMGRYDTRDTGINTTPGGERTPYDPSDTNVTAPITEMFLTYVRDELGYKSNLLYDGGIDPWNWSTGGFGGGYADVSQMLQSAFAKNPYMHLFIAEGYFDMATPFFEAQYSMKHLFLPPAAQTRITVGHYEVGHMIYFRQSARIKLAHDIQAFITGAERPTQ